MFIWYFLFVNYLHSFASTSIAVCPFSKMSFSALNQYDFYEYTCTLHLDVLTNDINLKLLKLYSDQTVHQFHSDFK